MGEPHLQISIATRGKATICPRSLIDENHASVDDHDFHCVNFTLSVNVIVDIKDSLAQSDCDEVLQSYYRGTYACFSILMWNDALVHDDQCNDQDHY